MGRPPKNKHAPGITQRGNIYWLKYTVAGKQIAVSLKTSDYAEAVKEAALKRGRPPAGLESTWDQEVSRYVEAKRRLRKNGFTANTVETVRYALKSFQKYSGTKNPKDVTARTLQAYYDSERETLSENTIQPYCAKIAAFLRWADNRVELPDYDGTTTARDVVIPKETIQRLIAECKRDDIRFVLFCGFLAGMRKGEIIMAKVEWFHLDLNEIRVPAMDGIWRPKDRESRKIPVTKEFKAFLEGFLPKSGFVLHPNANGERYRWDFRRPFDNYLATQGVDFSPHDMRHSYTSHLARANVPIANLEEWTGDKWKTLAKHYAHGENDHEMVSDVMAGRNKEPQRLTADEVAEAVARALNPNSICPFEW